MREFEMKGKKNISESISLGSWVDSFRNEEEMREIFLNMDRAMRYIHERGYCVASFDPRKIKILNNSVNQIKFDEIMPMPADSFEQKKFIKEDIYNSSFIQIGMYANCLYFLKRDFLKSNFDSFAQFLPEGDIPYYRGVIERGATVYFCEYAQEKLNRDLNNLENELAGNNGVSPSQKRTANNSYDSTGINDKINAVIYKQISGVRDSAFISLLIYPTILLVLGVIIAMIIFAISIIK